MKYADLHIHTNKSDGTFSPQEAVEYAAGLGLNAIAITDHDSVEGIPLARQAAGKYNIEIIPGIELSAGIDNGEVHILGYGIDFTKKWFLKKLDELRRYRAIRAQKIIEKLNKQGIDININEILNISDNSAIGRMHIARVLLQKGYIHSIPEAFKKYIGGTSPAYVPKHMLAYNEIIHIIRRLGGISVIAHPQIMGKDIWIQKMAKEGLDGIEVYYNDHNKKGELHYLALAKSLHLLVTGGSDCHGTGKGKILMGSVKIPYSLVEKLKERINGYKIH